jgi:hypothetical protein
MCRLLAFMLIAALAAPALAHDQPKSLKTARAGARIAQPLRDR